MNVLSFPFGIALGVYPRHAWLCVSSHFLRFEYTRSYLLTPSDIEMAESVHSEAFDVESCSLVGWPKGRLGAEELPS
jgi:hypothetical protein